MKNTITINDVQYPIDVPDDMPLLWFLRDKLELTGTKYGCGEGLCGACTVHVNGFATRACITPISAIAGSNVTTIEGLSEQGDHPLQKAWLEHNVPQCGYCQAGQIMSAASLLKTNPNPTDDDIVLGMQGNICRCGTFQRIKKAIKSASYDLAKEVS